MLSNRIGQSLDDLILNLKLTKPHIESIGESKGDSIRKSIGQSTGKSIRKEIGKEIGKN